MKRKPRARVAPPPERLIEAAIQQIEEHGLANVTVRGVATAAGVNIAAVNYYFRSKEALIANALEGTVRHMVADTDQYLERLPDDPPGVLSELLAYYLEGGLRFPQIGKAHLHDAFVTGEYGGAFPTLYAPAMLRLRDALMALVPGLNERSAAQRVVGALSAVFFPAFFAGLYRPLGALDTPEARTAYVRDLARQALLPPALTSEVSEARR